MALTKKQSLLLFLCFWLHVSIMDLFFVSVRGPVFLWEENLQPLTFATHFVIALFSTGLIYLLSKVVNQYREGRLNVSENIWALCSVCLVVSIFFVLV